MQQKTGSNNNTNQLQLYAKIETRKALRYTPAGIPVLELQLHHCSEVTEANIQRKIEMTLPAVVCGELTDELAHIELGHVIFFTGFLAPKRKEAASFKFHITAFKF